MIGDMSSISYLNEAPSSKAKELFLAQSDAVLIAKYDQNVTP